MFLYSVSHSGRTHTIHESGAQKYHNEKGADERISFAHLARNLAANRWIKINYTNAHLRSARNPIWKSASPLARFFRSRFCCLFCDHAAVSAMRFASYVHFSRALTRGVCEVFAAGSGGFYMREPRNHAHSTHKLSPTPQRAHGMHAECETSFNRIILRRAHEISKKYYAQFGNCHLATARPLARYVGFCVSFNSAHQRSLCSTQPIRERARLRVTYGITCANCDSARSRNRRSALCTSPREAQPWTASAWMCLWCVYNITTSTYVALRVYIAYSDPTCHYLFV